MIYTGGGADITGGVLTDTTNSFVFDPVANTIGTIADIPRATSNTRGLNLCGQMYVLGGSFNTISNEVDIYDPVSNTWSIGQPFAIARRNAASDTDGTNNIWLAGGYDSSVAPIASTGNLQLSGESLRDAESDAYSYSYGNGYNHTTTCVAHTIGDPATADAKAAANAVPSSLTAGSDS